MSSFLGVQRFATDEFRYCLKTLAVTFSRLFGTLKQRLESLQKCTRRGKSPAGSNIASAVKNTAALPALRATLVPTWQPATTAFLFVSAALQLTRDSMKNVKVSFQECKITSLVT